MIRKDSTVSNHSNAPSKISVRSKQYKEEVKQLVQQIVEIQTKINRNPELYTSEVVKFVDLFKKEYDLVKESPGRNNEKFIEISMFLSKVAHYYKDDMVFFIEDLMELINHFLQTLNPYLRKKVTFCLLKLRAKSLVQPNKMVIFLMKLFNCQDKELRRLIHRFIVKDIKNLNKKHKQNKFNKQMQTFMVELLKKSSDNMAKRAIQIMIELYKRNIWNDANTINIIATGCFNNNYKIRLLACYFLIQTTEIRREDLESSSSDDEPVAKKKGRSKSIKPTKARERRVEKEKKTAQKKQKKKMLKNMLNQEFFPIDQIYSPQDFAEKLFGQLKKLSNDKFDSQCKLAAMQVISRLIHRNNLILIPYYTFLQKYLYPNQKSIAKILSYLTEAIHESIPGDELQGTVRHLIENFINDHCSDQTLSMGLRTMSIMVTFHKGLLDEFNVNYLAGYSKYRNKNVSNAAKSIINHYREQNPKMLERKYRGKQWMSKDELDGPEVYRGERILDCIVGAELLQEEEERKTNVGRKGDTPIYLDRVLTDDDFKRIRALQRKKEIEAAERQSLKKMNLLQEEEEEEEEEEGDASEISGEDEWDGDEDEDDEWEDEEEEEEEEEEGNELKEANKRRRKNIHELEAESDSVQQFYSNSEFEDSEENPHGFVKAEAIEHYKLNKTEQKVKRKEMQETEEKEKKQGGVRNDAQVPVLEEEVGAGVEEQQGEAEEQADLDAAAEEEQAEGDAGEPEEADQGPEEQAGAREEREGGSKIEEGEEQMSIREYNINTMEFTIAFENYQLYDNTHVFYNIRVTDTDTFKSWTIQTDLEQLEEMHRKVQDENPEVPLPAFPKRNLFDRILNNWFFTKLDKDEIAKKQKELEHYLLLLIGVQKPPSIMTIKHFLRHGNLKASTTSNFEFQAIQTRDQLYKHFSKYKKIATTTFSKVYALKMVKNIPKKSLYMYYILRKLTFDTPQLAQVSENFIVQNVNLLKKSYQMLNNYPQYFGQVYTIFLQNSKSRKAPLKCWILQEYFQYTLKSRIDKQRQKNEHFTSQFVIETLQGIAKALWQMQELGISHKNLKASNIVFDENSQVKIIDFQDPSIKLKDQLAISKNLADCCYRSPEKKYHHGRVIQNNYKQDAWGLGMTMIMLCTLCTEAQLTGIQDQDTQHEIIISEQLSLITQLYGERLSTLLAKLVCKSQDVRIDLKELNELVNEGRIVTLEGITKDLLTHTQKAASKVTIRNLDKVPADKQNQVFLQLEKARVSLKLLQAQSNELKKLFLNATYIQVQLSNTATDDHVIIELLNYIFVCAQPFTLVLDLRSTPVTDKFVETLGVILQKLQANHSLTLDITNCLSLSENYLDLFLKYVDKPNIRLTLYCLHLPQSHLQPQNNHQKLVLDI